MRACGRSVFSFQTKLVLAMTGVIVIALLFAGAVYVARDRANSKERALDRVAASSPLVYQEAFKALDPRTRDDDRPFSETLEQHRPRPGCPHPGRDI